MIRNYLNRILKFSSSEIYNILKYSIGNILINSVPKSVVSTYEILKELEKSGIYTEKIGDYLLVHYPIQLKEYKIYLKRHSSDCKVFEQILLKKEYYSIIKLFEKLKIEPQVMIDAGANIGLTSMYFSAHYPNCKIIALEPVQSTFIRLKHNIVENKLNNFILLEKGLWKTTTKLSLDTNFRDKLDWSFRLTENQSASSSMIDSVSINDIIKDFNINLIDFLKIDIEGGEVEVFADNADTEWLEKVKIIAIEIHDEFDCREQIEDILKSKKFHLMYSGELTIAINNKLTNENREI